MYQIRMSVKERLGAAKQFLQMIKKFYNLWIGSKKFDDGKFSNAQASPHPTHLSKY